MSSLRPLRLCGKNFFPLPKFWAHEYSPAVRWITLLALLFLTGCAGPGELPAAPLDPTGPYVLHLPGIDGPGFRDSDLAQGLHKGGLDAFYEIFDWTHEISGLSALRNYKWHREIAADVARAIVRAHLQAPFRPIILSAESGGAGIAIFALEALPEDMRVDCLLLIAPAVSPDYDLSRALAHVSGGCHVFSSTQDRLILGFGTQLFGTIDGKHITAAGVEGFIMPPTAISYEYAKLVDHPWQHNWASYGNGGDHTGALAKLFAQKIIAPLLLTELDRRYARNN
jgi:hypothetical protein